MKTADDEKQVEEYQRTGDKSLLEEIVGRNFDRVYRFVASMVRNQDTIDDLVQDVLLSVVKNVHQFRGESKFSTWLYRITANRVHRFF